MQLRPGQFSENALWPEGGAQILFSKKMSLHFVSFFQRRKIGFAQLPYILSTSIGCYGESNYH
jgi:hypothetical protein